MILAKKGDVDKENSDAWGREGGVAGGGVVAVRLSSIVAYGRSNSCRLAASSFYLGDRFVNMEMVRDDFAWRYVTYDKPGEFTAAEADAREHSRGLWADPNPVPPWEWRRTKRAAAQSR